MRTHLFMADLTDTDGHTEAEAVTVMVWPSGSLSLLLDDVGQLDFDPEAKRQLLTLLTGHSVEQAA